MSQAPRGLSQALIGLSQALIGLRGLSQALTGLIQASSRPRLVPQSISDMQSMYKTSDTHYSACITGPHNLCPVRTGLSLAHIGLRPTLWAPHRPMSGLHTPQPTLKCPSESLARHPESPYAPSDFNKVTKASARPSRKKKTIITIGHNKYYKRTLD